MGLTKLIKSRGDPSWKMKEQKIFSCPKCNNELFLIMKFCDKCGSEIEWPEEYQYIINPGSKKNKL